mmetsp:Transcript_106287/g.216746  ORF Transcript_106287/g.216746 Transcript_106287/m.216746 type:complete len:116 (+) Transcript_106287:28-375(+)
MLIGRLSLSLFANNNCFPSPVKESSSSNALAPSCVIQRKKHGGRQDNNNSDDDDDDNILLKDDSNKLMVLPHQIPPALGFRQIYDLVQIIVAVVLQDNGFQLRAVSVKVAMELVL